jgi:AcrR family transcriptional regulator
MPQKAQGAVAGGKARVVVPNARRRELTRAAVLKAAAAAFDEAGYLAATLDDIVARTGMTKGAVYFHFASKEALAGELAALHYARLEEIVVAAADVEYDALGQMVLLTLAVAEAAGRDAVLRAGARLSVERHVVGGGIADPFEWWVRLLSGYARRARREGVLVESVAPAALARLLATFMLGAVQLGSGGQRFDLYRQLDEFWLLFEPAVRA